MFIVNPKGCQVGVGSALNKKWCTSILVQNSNTHTHEKKKKLKEDGYVPATKFHYVLINIKLEEEGQQVNHLTFLNSGLVHHIW